MRKKRAEENIQKRKKAQRDKRLEENYKKQRISCLIGVLAEGSRENWTRAKFEDIMAENFQK